MLTTKHEAICRIGVDTYFCFKRFVAVAVHFLPCRFLFELVAKIELHFPHSGLTTSGLTNLNNRMAIVDITFSSVAGWSLQLIVDLLTSGDSAKFVASIEEFEINSSSYGNWVSYGNWGSYENWGSRVFKFWKVDMGEILINWLARILSCDGDIST